MYIDGPQSEYVVFNVHDETVCVQGGIYTMEQLDELVRELHAARMAIWKHLIFTNRAKEIDG
jgi:hypothetical protein